MAKSRIILIISVIACVFIAIAINGAFKFGNNNKDCKSDNSFIIYTVKEYSKKGWYWYNTSMMYQITDDEIIFFVDRIFYNPDKTKLIAWIGEKTYNAPTIEKYGENEMANKMCPFAGDTVYNFTVLAGYKEDNGLWKLYPWGNRQVPCCNTISIGEKELEQYYFEDIKKDYFEAVEQEGKLKGIVRNQLYTYGLSEKEFWNSPLWRVDSIGANNEYPFEVKYIRVLTDTCIKCAEKIKLPQIEYPDSIIMH